MINILPKPKICREIHKNELSFCTAIVAKDAAFSKFIPTLSEIFKKIHGVGLAEESGGFILAFDGKISPSSYVIDTSDGFTIRASDKEGLLYGFASAIQLIRFSDGMIFASSVHIEDGPDKEYRALMLDLSRNWYKLNQVLKFVDLCFLYKVNYLHLHFIDNERYTLPSKSFPKIPTEGESYTEEEIKFLVEYAYERGINIVPEFECPGHAKSLVTKYPELFSNESISDGGKFYNELGVEITADSLLCAGSEKSLSATYELLREICDMFPYSKYLHIGGDEATISLWDQCPHCKKYMQENNIDGIYDLYSDYVARISDKVLSYGKIPMVWEGFPKIGAERISKKVVVIAWESHYHLAPDLLSEGFSVINASWQPLYIVPWIEYRWTPYDILDWNVYNWQHWWEKSYAALNPITVPETAKVLGSSLCAWESTYEQSATRIMENLAAMNERAWNTCGNVSKAEYTAVFNAIYKIAAKIMQ